MYKIKNVFRTNVLLFKNLSSGLPVCTKLLYMSQVIVCMSVHGCIKCINITNCIIVFVASLLFTSHHCLSCP